MILKPGDLIFYPDDGKWNHRFFSLIQKWGKEMGSLTDKSFTHVAMIASEPDLVVEMSWPHPRFRLFADDTREKIVMRPKCDDVTKLRALYWCYLNTDDNYSFLNMALGEFGIKEGYKVCSGWLNKAFRVAGYPLWNVKDKMVSPNELFCSDKLEFVE